MESLLVFGGTGYLGQRLVARATSRYSIVATHHSTAPTSEDVRWQSLDVRDAGAISALVGRVRPAVVVNCAYVHQGTDLIAVTARAPGVMAAAAYTVGAQFVHLSTDVIFPGRYDRAYVENDEPAPVHDYGRAKANAEQAVQQSCPDALVIRTSLIYGGPQPGPQERLVDSALSGGKIEFFTDEIRNPIRVDDLADAILELVASSRRGIYNVAGADAVDRLTFAQLLAASAGNDPSTLRGRTVDPTLGPRPTCVALDCSKVTAVLRHTRLTGVRAAAN